MSRFVSMAEQRRYIHIRRQKYPNHYDYLEQNFFNFLRKLGVSENHINWNCGIIVAHGDKAYGYQDKWERAGIPFEKGVAIYLLTYIKPWSQEVRETKEGWVEVDQWVIDKADKFIDLLP